MALADLQLAGVVGSSWARATEEGITFSKLSVRQAEGLVRLLEDLARPAPAAYEQLVRF
jgi:hypothetical protein